jgi:hypothetical protein
MAVPTNDWLAHAACANPPAVWGACTLRFPDGRYWCVRCDVAWRPPPVAVAS